MQTEQMLELVRSGSFSCLSTDSGGDDYDDEDDYSSGGSGSSVSSGSGNSFAANMNLPHDARSALDELKGKLLLRHTTKPCKLPAGYAPTELDVCSGRGKSNWKHAGNVRFRNIIQERVGGYIEAPTKSDKSIVVVTIVDDIRRSGGRFLKQDDDGNWYDIGDNLAREKVGHSLRDQVTSLSKKQDYRLEMMKQKERRRRQLHELRKRVGAGQEKKQDHKKQRHAGRRSLTAAALPMQIQRRPPPPPPPPPYDVGRLPYTVVLPSQIPPGGRISDPACAWMVSPLVLALQRSSMFPAPHLTAVERRQQQLLRQQTMSLARGLYLHERRQQQQEQLRRCSHGQTHRPKLQQQQEQPQRRRPKSKTRTASELQQHPREKEEQQYQHQHRRQRDDCDDGDSKVTKKRRTATTTTNTERGSFEDAGSSSALEDRRELILREFRRWQNDERNEDDNGDDDDSDGNDFE